MLYGIDYKMDIRKMDLKEFDKYQEGCDVIRKLILKHYTDNKFEFVVNPSNLYVEVIINDTSKISLLPDSNWKQVKKQIDKKLMHQQERNTEDCIVCYERIRKNVSCPQCLNNYCADCYLKIFINGKGIITCPHCRWTYGTRMSDDMILLGAMDIMDKIKCRC